jgi:uncharacterized tellurite resistance protein B-like protein
MGGAHPLEARLDPSILLGRKARAAAAIESCVVVPVARGEQRGALGVGGGIPRRGSVGDGLDDPSATDQCDEEQTPHGPLPKGYAIRARGQTRLSDYTDPVEAETREKIIGLIEDVVAADGVVTDEERDFLRRVLERFGMGDSQRPGREAPSAPGSSVATLRALEPDVQLRVMALLVEAAVADGCVAPEERAFLLASAAALGIEAQALEDRIARRLKSNVPGV